jgi:DNA-binding LytR/AlgR family response regulator
MKIQLRDQIYFFKDKQVIRFEAHQRKTNMLLSNGESQTLDISIEAIEKQLINTGFIRVHPGHIVNINYISTISDSNSTVIELENGDIIPVDNETKESLTQGLKNHIHE